MAKATNIKKQKAMKGITPRRIRAQGRALMRPTPLHAIVDAANPTAEQRAKSDYQPIARPNPLGEVITPRGEVLQHIVCRRVPRFETLHRRGVIGKREMSALEWYETRRAMAAAGLTRCALDVSGSGGGGSAGISRSEAVREAASDIAWARGFIPVAIRPVFDAVMEDEASFVECAGRFFSNLKPTTARQRVSRCFQQAVSWLVDGLGDRLGRV